MRIGLLCHGWFPDLGGVESHTRDLAAELIRRGHTVGAIALDYAEDHEPYSVTDAEVEGVDVRRMAYRYHDHRALADLVNNPNTARVAVDWFRQREFDVVHVHHPTGFSLGVLPGLREAGAQLVMTLHDYWPLCPRGQMLHPEGTVCARPEAEVCAACLAHTWPHLMPGAGAEARDPDGVPVADDVAAAAGRTAWALRALELPHRLLTPSAAARAVYARAGVDAARIEVCENGVPVDGLVLAVRGLRGDGSRSGDGPRRLGVLGTVLPSKGALELARAFRAADPEGWILDVHGNLPPYHGDASYIEALQELAREDERIQVHGPYDLDELPRILAGLDGVAAPSRWAEVFGLTVREARAVGLPVLVSDAGDLGSVALGGQAGIVVGAEDHAGWVDALRRFTGDHEARAAWADHPRRPRSIAAMTNQIERVYRELVGKQPWWRFW